MPQIWYQSTFTFTIRIPVNFFLKSRFFYIGAKVILILNLPLKCDFSRIFKIIVESSPIAHSIGNFILKSFKSEHFLIKGISYEIWRIKLYDVMYRNIRIWRHISTEISFIINVQNQSFSVWMSYMWTLNDNFENLQEMTF